MHCEYGAASSEHEKVEFSSLDVNVNEAVLEVLAPLGPEVMVVDGGVVSSPSQVTTSCGRTLPSRELKSRPSDEVGASVKL